MNKFSFFLIPLLLFALSCTKDKNSGSSGGLNFPLDSFPITPPPPTTTPSPPDDDSAAEEITPLTTECNDGIDNDGDGLTDYGLDLGCTHPESPKEGGLLSGNKNDAGWTVFKKSTDTIIIYVSQSEGDDNFSGLIPYKNADSTDGPKKTIKNAITLLRANQPDWLLLKRGDIWSEDLSGVKWDFSGQSKENKKIFGAYGLGKQKPEIQMINNTGALLNVNDTNAKTRYQGHFAMIGLKLSAPHRNPESINYNYDIQKEEHTNLGNGKYQAPTALLWRSSKDNFDVLIEGCEFSYFGKNVVQITSNKAEFWLNDFTIRRNTFERNYGFSLDTLYSQSQTTAFYANGHKNLILEENIFDHNGWLPHYIETGRNYYSKSIYLGNTTEGAQVLKNIISRSSNFGLQVLSPALLKENILFENPTHVYVNASNTSVSNNTFIGGGNVEYGNSSGLKGIGVQLTKNSQFTNIKENYFLTKDNCDTINPPDQNGRCIGSGSAIEVHSLSLNTDISNNNILDWNSSVSGSIRIYQTNDNLSLVSNKILNFNTISPLVSLTSGTKLPKGSLIKENLYFINNTNDSEWFTNKNKWFSFKEWLNLTLEEESASRFESNQTEITETIIKNLKTRTLLESSSLSDQLIGWIEKSKKLIVTYSALSESHKDIENIKNSINLLIEKK